MYSEFDYSDTESNSGDDETQESIISTEDELDDKFIEDTMEEMLEAVEKDLEQNDDDSQTCLSQSLEAVEGSSPMKCMNKPMKSSWKGFKIVGDNIDKNFRRSFQRVDFQTRSFHYFHSYAVLDRIDLSGYTDTPSSGEVDFTPSDDEISSLLQVFGILVSRYGRNVFCMYVYKIIIMFI